MASAVVLVTGASRGIGLAVARILLERNHKVVTLARSQPQALGDLATKYPNDIVNIRGDVADPTVVASAVSTAKERFGSLDALVLNAATATPFGNIADATASPVEAWRAHLETNVISLVAMLQCATPLLRESAFPGGARVVFVSSGAATGNTAAWGPYNASKAAMNSITRTFANEEPTITSVSLRPGVVNTEMQSVIRSTGRESMKSADYNKFIALHEGGKLLSPDVPAKVIVGLALGAPRELSGQFLNIDGPECAPYKL